MGHVFFSIMSGMGHQDFVPLRGGGSCFFEEPGFHFLWPTPPPVLFDQPLILVTMTYHKAMTGSVPFCPLMFSWQSTAPLIVGAQVCVRYFVR